MSIFPPTGQQITHRGQNLFLYHRTDKQITLVSRITGVITFGGFPFKSEFIGELRWEKGFFIIGESKITSLFEALDLLLAIESARKLCGVR